jgi:hypothetical protein
MFIKLLLATSVFGFSTHLFAKAPEYAGCKESDFVTVEGPEVKIEFQGSSYEPACIKVKKGTRVILPASQKHPLQGSVDFEDLVNPIRKTDGAYLADLTMVADAVGYWGYYCTRHADPETGDGMGGLVWIVE